MPKSLQKTLEEKQTAKEIGWLENRIMSGYLFKLFVTCCVAFLVVFWWKGQGFKLMALKLAQKHCDELGLQFLDQSVALRSFKFTRGPTGAWVVRRRFVFEFASIGDERYKGTVELLGNRLLKLELEPHRL